MDIISNAGGAGSFSFADSSSNGLPSANRGRARSADFGLPERTGLLDLARTYLETQARLWPELAGTPAVPAADAATIATLANEFERRFRQQHAGVFRPKGTPRAWTDLGVAWFFIDDLSRMSRNTIESLRLGELAGETGVRVIGASDGFDSANPQATLLLPVIGSMNEAFITQLRSKVKRGMDDAFRRGDNVQPPGVGYRMVEVKDAEGNLVITHKGTIEKAVEVDPEAAEWTRRGAEMIAYEGKSAIAVARIFNEHKVGGKQTWSDSRIRQHFGRPRLVGRDVFRRTKVVTDRQTGNKKIVKLPQKDWMWRELPHLRILSDELATAVRAKLGLGAESFGRKARDPAKKAHRVDLYPKVLIRPICGGCGHPMSLGRSTGKYRAFACLNATTGIKGCTNRGYKSDRIIDEAVLGTVMATLFTESFITDLTADVNVRLAELANRPIPSTKKLEQKIANEERRLKRLTDRLAKVDDTDLDAVFATAREMEQQLAANREELKQLQRAGRRPKVKSVREQDVVAALCRLRELLQGDVGVAAQVLKAIVGDVVIEKRQVEGQAKPQMVARFTINAIPALAVLDCGGSAEADGSSLEPWKAVCQEQPTSEAQGIRPTEVVVPLNRKCHRTKRTPPVTPPGGSQAPRA